VVGQTQLRAHHPPDQRAGDQEPGQRQEDVDAAGDAAVAEEVEDHHERQRQPPQPVDLGDPLGTAGVRHRVRLGRTGDPRETPK
jgi:hypothetical protein